MVLVVVFHWRVRLELLAPQELAFVFKLSMETVASLVTLKETVCSSCKHKHKHNKYTVISVISSNEFLSGAPPHKGHNRIHLFYRLSISQALANYASIILCIIGSPSIGAYAGIVGLILLFSTNIWDLSDSTCQISFACPLRQFLAFQSSSFVLSLTYLAVQKVQNA